MLPKKFSIATIEDVPQLVKLVNSAYRGDESKKGWTTEADLLDGIRTDNEALEEMIDKPGAVIIKYSENEEITGSVFLEKQGTELYLGMLTVKPTAQATGIGKKLVAVSEEYAKQVNCASIKMTVISSRTELISWYERQGYHNTGEKKPFPTDPRFGIPKQALEFIVMKKDLS